MSYKPAWTRRPTPIRRPWHDVRYQYTVTPVESRFSDFFTEPLEPHQPVDAEWWAQVCRDNGFTLDGRSWVKPDVGTPGGNP